MPPPTKKIKLELFNILIRESNTFGAYDDIYNFCSLVWDLDSMPSTDSRFKNASGS